MRAIAKIRWLIPVVIACAAMWFFVPSAYAQDAQTSCTVNSNANVRSGPGMSFQVVNGLKLGTTVTVVEKNSDSSWSRHATGWTASFLLDCLGEPAEMAGTSKMTNTIQSAEWSIKWFSGATDQMRGKGTLPWPAFAQLDPENWPNFPNVDNTTKNFPAAHGLEYGEDESEFCGARGDGCEVTVPAMHYRMITGDWEIPGVGKCIGTKEGIGCALMLVNVGRVTSNWADNVVLNNVFTVAGRYWHGDFLPDAIVALLSHAVNNMTNMESQLNPRGIVNAGANCSIPEGCAGVRAVFAVTSGNELLILGETTYIRK